MESKKKKIKRMVENIILVILIFIFLACLGLIVNRIMTYRTEDRENKKIANEYTFTLKMPVATKDEAGEEDVAEQVYDASYDTQGVDWDSLYAINPDYVGWIRMANGVNYPIVKGAETNEYLHKNFYGEHARSGSIMMNANNKADYSDPNTIIYGHNMADGSMFSMNRKYMDEAYANENPYFFIHIKGGYFTYRIIAAKRDKDGCEGYSLAIDSEEGLRKFNDFYNNRAYYKHEEICSGERYVTLSCCNGRSGTIYRLLLLGKMECFTSYNGTRISPEEYFRTKPISENYNPYVNDYFGG